MPDTTAMHGSLDSFGQAHASLRIPGGLPSTMVGRSFYFAAIAHSAGSAPEFSSIASTLTFLP